MDSDLVDVLYGVLLALWLGAGFADWLCHRISRIELTSGVAESRWHLVMHGQLVAALLAAALFEPGKGVVLLCGALTALHLATSYVDTRTADPRRGVRPLEQHVHSFLDVLPFVAVLLLFLQHAGDGPSHDWGLQLRDPPLPPRIWIALAVAVLGSSAFLVEEYVRCRRRAHERAGFGPCGTPPPS